MRPTSFFQAIFRLTQFALFYFVVSISAAKSQTPNSPKERIAILSIAVKQLTIDSEQAANVVRTELDKINKYDVMDKYDVEYSIQKLGEKMPNTDCYSKMCLLEIGKKIKADKMMTGIVELIGENITVTLKLLDIGTGNVERTQVIEFLDIRPQVNQMIAITTRKMYGEPIDNELFTKLTKKFEFSNTVNTPNQQRLSLNGPRMGFTYFTGAASEILKAKAQFGGFDAQPLMFQFGYQFEVQYLNQGNFQALFEFIPLVTGLDQGKFLPSLSILNGMRDNRSGWEFAFGPIIYLTTQADGYYNNNNEWILGALPTLNPNNYFLEKRFDSRGTPTLETSFVFAIGKSFKSGNLNIPVNLFVIPNKSGLRLGISMGFNSGLNKQQH